MEWASDMVAGWRVKGMIWSDWSGVVRCLGIGMLRRVDGVRVYKVTEDGIGSCIWPLCAFAILDL